MQAEKILRVMLEKLVSEWGIEWPKKAQIEPPKERSFGDLAINLAMVAAPELKKKPRDLALEISNYLLDTAPPESPLQGPTIETAEVAGPGFVNVRFSADFWRNLVNLVLERENYGHGDWGKNKRILLEFVSANPTGPLHIGHGRGAAVGDSLARILRASGYDVFTEYYINDAGRQMNLLGLSIYLRALEVLGQDFEKPEDWYKGEYIVELAREVLVMHPDLAEMPEKRALDICQEHGIKGILDGIKKDLEDFGVVFDEWFSEKELLHSGEVAEVLAGLKNQRLTYEEDGALWFDSTKFGDDKNRVLRKASGDLTYFASDIAYHSNKFKRGFNLLVDIWGADHHGYMPRMKAGVEALGRSPEDLKIILVQLVNLLRNGEAVAMSTRAGEFVTLAQVIEEVGADAARFMFLSRKSDSQLDFDLELVRSKSMDNPVYYVQYAHARVMSILSKAKERQIEPGSPDKDTLSWLGSAGELEILRLLDAFPDTVASAASTLSPHLVSFYLQELAGVFHRYYSTHSVLDAGEEKLVQARMLLVMAVSRVIKNGLQLLGVKSPDKM